jgi:uncharacterized lipoprotein YajG
MSATMRFLSAAAAGLMLFGCAATPPNPNSKPTASAAVQDRTCLTDTGSQIAAKSSCRGYGRSYTSDDIDRTGKTTAAGALSELDPSITVHH